MTPLAMKPGRELDVVIAERVMGWSRRGAGDHTKPEHRPSKDFPGRVINNWDSKGPHDYLESPGGRSRIYFCGCDDIGEEIPRYSSDIAATWEVVERLHKLDPDDGLKIWFIGHWQASFGATIADADTAPHAICLAALKAVVGEG